MAKQRPIRNSELKEKETTKAMRPHEPDTIFGVPRHRLPLIILFFGITIGSFVVWGLFQRPPMLDEYTYEVIDSYPHDRTSFTQGLVFHNGFVYESIGLYGQSKIRKLNLDGKVVKERALDQEYFGEGLALVGDKLIQLTWKENKAFVYDLDLNTIGEFSYNAQGWGLTYDGKQLIMSDGTSKLYFLNPDTFEIERTVLVRKGNTRMPDINELEWINNIIYANVLNDDMIYMIQPTDGKVIGRINFQNLYPRAQRLNPREDVMNGIAIRPDTGNILVTGKNWPEIFEVKLNKVTPDEQ